MSIASTIPILCIHGVDDQHMIQENHERFMKSNFGNIEYHKLLGVGHMAFWEAAETTNRLILVWVGKVEGAK